MSLEKNDITIVRVSGLMVLDGKNETLARTMQERLGLRVEVIAPTPPHKSAEHPERTLDRGIAQMREAAGKSKGIVLVGCSYGALVALMIACRTEFERILAAILIEGPLHPAIAVEPPGLVPVLGKVCGQHYLYRPVLAAEGVHTLEEIGTEKIMVVANRSDGVVPPLAQKLPLDLQEFDMQDGNLDPIRNADPARGTQIILPPHLMGVRKGVMGVLPQDYLNHLSWSDGKFEFITALVDIAIQRALARQSGTFSTSFTQSPKSSHPMASPFICRS